MIFKTKNIIYYLINLKEKISKLKEQNSELQNQTKITSSPIRNTNNVSIFAQENEELKVQVNSLNKAVQSWKDAVKEAHDENALLQQKIEKMKDESSKFKLIKDSFLRNNNETDSNKDDNYVAKKVIEMQNNESKLQEILHTDDIISTVQNVLRENEKLKRELKEARENEEKQKQIILELKKS